MAKHVRLEHEQEECSRGACPDHNPIGNLQGTRISIKLGLNFDQARIQSGGNQQCHGTCPGFECQCEKERAVKMSSYGKLQTLVICLGQLLVSKIHSNFNSRNKIAKQFAILVISILLHGKFCTALYFSISGAKSLK